VSLWEESKFKAKWELAERSKLEKCARESISRYLLVAASKHPEMVKCSRDVAIFRVLASAAS